jgi:hypothetical protein
MIAAVTKPVTPTEAISDWLSVFFFCALQNHANLLSKLKTTSDAKQMYILFDEYNAHAYDIYVCVCVCAKHHSTQKQCTYCFISVMTLLMSYMRPVLKVFLREEKTCFRIAAQSDF